MTARRAGASGAREVVTPEGVPLRFAVALAGDRARRASSSTSSSSSRWSRGARSCPSAVLAARGTPRRRSRPRDRDPRRLPRPHLLLHVLRALLAGADAREARGCGLRVIDARGGPLTGGGDHRAEPDPRARALPPHRRRSSRRTRSSRARPAGRRLAAVVLDAAPRLPAPREPRPAADRRPRGGDGRRARRRTRVLLEDLAADAAPREAFPFTDAQLDVYGVYELQVLEQVLRGRGQAGARRGRPHRRGEGPREDRLERARRRGRPVPARRSTRRCAGGSSAASSSAGGARTSTTAVRPTRTRGRGRRCPRPPSRGAGRGRRRRSRRWG